VSLARDSGLALLASAGTAPVVLLASVVLARSLDPAAHGQVQAALSLAVLCTTLGNAGFVAATIHRLRGARRPAPEALGTGLVGVTIAGLLLVAVGVALGDVVRAELLLGASPWVLAATLMALLPTLWSAVGAALARGMDRFVVWTRLEWAQKAGRLLVWAALWASGFASAETVLAGVVVVEVVALGWTAWQLRQVGWPSTSTAELAAAVRFGAPASLTTLGGQLHERLDLFLLAILRDDPVEVAVYAVAVGVVNRLRVVPLSLASALYPRVAGADPAEGIALAARVCRVSVAGSLGLGLGVLAVAPVVMPWLFGATYGASVPLMVVLAPGTVAYGVYLVLARWFQGVQRQRVNVASLAVAGAVNLALNLWWIPTYGAMGAAAASLVSYGLQGGLLLASFVREPSAGLVGTVVMRWDDLAALRR